MPLEIKNRIYELAFGGHVIHITDEEDDDDDVVPLSNTICRALISEEEAQENFENETVHPWYAPTNVRRHECCRTRKITTPDEGEDQPKALSLGALRSCRQIYNEAHHIPYSANTLSFNNPRVLQSFVLSIASGNSGNHLAVRSLSIEVCPWFFFEDPRWTSAVITCAKQLKALQKLNIEIHFDTWKSWPESPAQWDEPRNHRKDIFSSLAALRRLPLRIVTIIISDDHCEPSLDPLSFTDLSRMDRWTLNKKKVWAHYIRGILLGSSQ